MGTGKTFVAESFATESGLTCLKLKNFRDKWVGSTEANLEKVLDLVEALGYVLLVVDEADRGLSARRCVHDGGVNSPCHRPTQGVHERHEPSRARVVILMMTNRPDKLDTDLKRPGRFDMKIPFFFPETADERRLIFEALVRKNKAVGRRRSRYDYRGGRDGWTSRGPSMEAVLLAAAALAGDEDAGHGDSAARTLDQASRDIIPSRDTRMLEYMEMLAVFECSAEADVARAIPGSLSTDDVQSRLDQLRVAARSERVG